VFLSRFLLNSQFDVTVPEEVELDDSKKFLFTPSIRLNSEHIDRNIFDSKELQVNILNSIQDGVSILDPELRIRYINNYMAYWYANPDNIIGKKCYEVYHGRKMPCENCPSIQAMNERVPVRGIVRYTIFGDEKGWQELLAVPIFDKDDAILGVFEYVRDITFQHRIQKELDNLMKRIDSLEMNNKAMTQLLQQRKEEVEQIEESIMDNMEKFIKPSLNHLKIKADECDVEFVEGLIEEIVYPITKKRSSILYELTSRERQIASLIKEGKTTKEIAEILFISTKTVEYHRGNIRNKLGLSKHSDRSVNLRSYLLTHL
jgi:DNA-binding CsgD family transcriptional regulator/PAS domain-containing protein